MTRFRVTRTGQDNWQPRASSGLSREYVHGRLLPMNAPEHSPRSFRRVLWLLAVFWMAALVTLGAIL